MDQKNIVVGKNKDHLVMLIERSTKDLHDRIDMQKFVLLNVLGRAGNNVPIDLYSVLDEPSKKFLQKVLVETIEVLEETKRAFKSKRLEELRKKADGCFKGDSLRHFRDGLRPLIRSGEVKA